MMHCRTKHTRSITRFSLGAVSLLRSFWAFLPVALFLEKSITKLKSEITDRELEDKVGPDGQEIYMDDNSNYYYVNESGEKVFVSQDDLKDRVR